MSPTFAVTIFHPVPDTQGFDAWLRELQACVRAADGWVSTSVSVHGEPQMEWAPSSCSMTGLTARAGWRC